MEIWAEAYGRDQVQFLCVCVESRQTAYMFQRMFQFEHAINAYIPGRPYMPVGYGQLGCSGFIVVDQNGCFVSRKTRAFLQYGEDAFRHVQELLATMLWPTNPGNSELTQKSENNNRNASEEKHDDSLSKVEPPPSVGVDSMDHEHEECTEKLNALLQFPSTKSLSEALHVLEAHFAHEEKLLEAYYQSSGSAGQKSEFSALTSHFNDHERILDLGRKVLGPEPTDGANVVGSDC